MTTVKELIEILQTMPQNAIVVLSSDGEGNKYSPLAAYDTAWYVEECSWAGWRIDDESDLDEDQKAIFALFLWPVN